MYTSIYARAVAVAAAVGMCTLVRDALALARDGATRRALPRVRSREPRAKRFVRVVHVVVVAMMLLKYSACIRFKLCVMWCLTRVRGQPRAELGELAAEVNRLVRA